VQVSILLTLVVAHAFEKSLFFYPSDNGLNLLGPGRVAHIYVCALLTSPPLI
jgi:hypothetical protein